MYSRHLRLFLPLLLILAGIAHALSPPKPSVSEYLRSTGAGFAMSREDGVQYAMLFAIEKPLGESIYATVLFENPEKGGAPLQKVVTLSADAKELSVKSDRLSVLHNNRKYLVEVRLYSDEGRARLTSTHRQEVLFSMPRKYLGQLEQEYGVRFD